MTPDRLYAVLNVQHVDPLTRRFSGIATTPTPDRRGDVIEPSGLLFDNPIPLLLHHDTQRPVGVARLQPPTAAGIAFDAELAPVDQPGVLRDRIDETWQSIRAGLLRGVSIGLLCHKADGEARKGGGMRWTRAEIIELSVVTIPMNRDASITTIKSLSDVTAATGPHTAGVPAAAGRTTMNLETATETITRLETTRTNQIDRIDALMADADARGETLTPDQAAEFDTLKKSIVDIDGHLERAKEREALMMSRARPADVVAGVGGPPAPVRPSGIVFPSRGKLPTGTAFTRYAMAIAAGKGNRFEALEFSKQWRDTTPEVEMVLKAAVAAGTTTDATWAAPLVPLAAMSQEFMELLRPATLIGRIPNLRRAPFNTNVPIQTGGGTYGWVGQGAPKPVTKLAFGTANLSITKCAGIILLTEELVRVSSPSAEAICRADMIAGIAAFLDAQFIDPLNAGVLNVAPASITNGLTPITSTGWPAGDLAALANALIGANMALSGSVLLMSEVNAFSAGLIVESGVAQFPNLSVSGGSISGVTVLTSQALGSLVILLQPQYVLMADDGQTVLDSSREASVQMNDTPDNPATATTVLVSLWQHNLVGLRAERFINWKRGMNAGVAYIADADYSTAATPTALAGPGLAARHAAEQADAARRARERNA